MRYFIASFSMSNMIVTYYLKQDIFDYKMIKNKILIDEFRTGKILYESKLILVALSEISEDVAIQIEDDGIKFIDIKNFELDIKGLN